MSQLLTNPIQSRRDSHTNDEETVGPYRTSRGRWGPVPSAMQVESIVYNARLLTITVGGLPWGLHGSASGVERTHDVQKLLIFVVHLL